MAKTEVQITAVDKTQAAIRSATTSLKTIEKTAKATGKAINLAFGLLTGGALVSAFGKLTEAAKKTEEGRQALDDLSRTLKDPALVSAANALTNTLISGFAKALQGAASMFKFVRSELIRMGIFGGAGGARDAADVIRGQIRDLERAIAAPGIGMTGESGQKLSQALIADLNARKQQLALVERLAEAEAEAERARIDRAVAAENTPAAKKKSGGSPRERAKKTKDDIDRWAMMALEDIEPTFQEFGEGLADSLVAGLDERLRPQTGPLADFAAEAAMQMQGAFADFLFDPFAEGLKGMARGFVNILRRMLADLMARQLLLGFLNIFTGGSGIVANIANAAAQGLQARAMGGPVTGNTPYMVGERGPELFVPSTGGTIIPNGAGGGMTVSPVYNIDARGATMELSQALPGILADNNRKIFDELDRRYGIRR